MTAQIISLKDKRKERGLIPEPTRSLLTGWPILDMGLLMNPFAILALETLKRAEKNATIVAYPGGIDDLPI